MHKKKLLYTLLLMFSLFVISCSNSHKDKYKIQDTNNINKTVITAKPTITPSLTENPKEQKTKQPKDHMSLGDEDFQVTDGICSVVLDSNFTEFKTNETETNAENSYVGETYSKNNDYVYKNYRHEYQNFLIYTSNLYYNLKNRSFDDYYITQITLISNEYKTNRGIFIGSDMSDIVRLYGEGKITEEDNKILVSYIFKNKKIVFTSNGKKKVTGIDLFIISPKDDD